MSPNQKLAPLLAGRTVVSVDPPAAPAAPPASPFAPSGESTWRVRFADGSTLAVRTDGTPPDGADGARNVPVVDVLQRGTRFTLALGGAGGRLTFRTAEPAACVLLRDGKGRMEYAD